MNNKTTDYQEIVQAECKASDIKAGDEVMFGRIVTNNGVWLNGWYEVESINGDKVKLSGLDMTCFRSDFAYRRAQEAR
jgi:hypothetical protein